MFYQFYRWICFHVVFFQNICCHVHWYQNLCLCLRASWSWSYGYMYNKRLSPLKLRVRIPLMARCTRYNSMCSSLSVTCGMSEFFPGTLISFTNKADCHDITEILLELALKTLTLWFFVLFFYQRRNCFI